MKSSHRRRLNLVRTYTTVQFCELTTWFVLWYCRHKSCTRAKHSAPLGLLLSERAISVLLWKSVWQTDRHNGAMLIMILAHAYPQTCGRTLYCLIQPTAWSYDSPAKGGLQYKPSYEGDIIPAREQYIFLF